MDENLYKKITSMSAEELLNIIENKSDYEEDVVELARNRLKGADNTEIQSDKEITQKEENAQAKTKSISLTSVILIVVLVICIMLGVAGGGIYFYEKKVTYEKEYNTAVDRFNTIYDRVIEVYVFDDLNEKNADVNLKEMEEIVKKYDFDAEYLNKYTYAKEYIEDLKILRKIDQYISESTAPGDSQEKITDFLEANKKIASLKNDKAISYFKEIYESGMSIFPEKIITSRGLYKVQQCCREKHPDWQIHSTLYLDDDDYRHDNIFLMAYGYFGKPVSVTGSQTMLSSEKDISSLTTLKSVLHTDETLGVIDANNSGMAFIAKLYDPENPTQNIDDELSGRYWNHTLCWYVGFNVTSEYKDGKMIYYVHRSVKNVPETLEFSAEDILNYSVINPS